MESFVLDLRAAARALQRAPAVTSAAILTLAIGTAGSTVMFALIEGVLLRPLPVHEQHRLVVAWREVPASGSAIYPFGSQNIEEVGRASTLLEAVAGVTRNGVGRSVVRENGDASYANVALVTGGFFDVLGVRPTLGRGFTRADDREGVENVVVISDRLWRRRYGAAREILGRRLHIDEQAFTIVGVMPPDLDFPAGVEIWRTTRSVPTDGPFGNAARAEVNLLGRLRPGVTVEQAADEITTLHQQLEAKAPTNAVRGLITVVRPYVQVVVGDARTTLIALFAAVAFVLLIAGANVANLLLMRAESRRGEMAVRIAIGAGRDRIMRQTFLESVILASLAGVVGLALAKASLGIVNVVPDGMPRIEAIRIDPPVVLFSIAVACLAALTAGLVPALSILRTNSVLPLRNDVHGAVGASSNVGRRTLVVAQVALAMAVVTGAGLLIRTVMRLQAIDLGMPATRLVLLDLYMPPARFAERHQHAQFLDDAIVQLSALPSVHAVTPVNLLPFLDRGWDVPRVTAEGQGPEQAAANPSLNLESVHPSYFATLEIPLLDGRPFTDLDHQQAPAVAIVSESLASHLWPGERAVGKRLKMGGFTSSAGWRTIVGVAAETRYRTLTVARPTLYLAAAQFQMTATNLVVRTTASLELLTSLAAERIRSIDTDVYLMRGVSFGAMLDRPLARPRFNALLLSIFAVVALVLSTIGLYAVMSAYVRQRRREIAIRQALGATAADVRRLVVGEILRLAGTGAVLGWAAGIAASRALRGMLFEVEPLDPSTTATAALLIICASAAASYLPVRNATSVDAAVTLRRP